MKSGTWVTWVCPWWFCHMKWQSDMQYLEVNMSPWDGTGEMISQPSCCVLTHSPTLPCFGRSSYGVTVSYGDTGDLRLWSASYDDCPLVVLNSEFNYCAFHAFHAFRAFRALAEQALLLANSVNSARSNWPLGSLHGGSHGLDAFWKRFRFRPRLLVTLGFGVVTNCLITLGTYLSISMYQ